MTACLIISVPHFVYNRVKATDYLSLEFFYEPSLFLCEGGGIEIGNIVSMN